MAVYIVTALYQALPFDWALAYGDNVYIFLGAVLAIFFCFTPPLLKVFMAELAMTMPPNKDDFAFGYNIGFWFLAHLILLRM